MARVFTAQIDTATKRVFAITENDNGLGAAPSGVLFVVFNPLTAGGVAGKYYVNGAFQDADPNG